MFPCEYCEMFKDTYVEEQLQMAALASHTKVSPQGPTLGSHLMVPPGYQVPSQGPGSPFSGMTVDMVCGSFRRALNGIMGQNYTEPRVNVFKDQAILDIKQ